MRFFFAIFRSSSKSTFGAAHLQGNTPDYSFDPKRRKVKANNTWHGPPRKSRTKISLSVSLPHNFTRPVLLDVEKFHPLCGKARPIRIGSIPFSCLYVRYRTHAISNSALLPPHPEELLGGRREAHDAGGPQEMSMSIKRAAAVNRCAAGWKWTGDVCFLWRSNLDGQELVPSNKLPVTDGEVCLCQAARGWTARCLLRCYTPCRFRSIHQLGRW